MEAETRSPDFKKHFVSKSWVVHMLGYDGFTKHEGLSQANKDGVLKNIVPLYGAHLAFLDDGNIYTIETK